MKVPYQYGVVQKTKDRASQTMPEDIRIALTAQLDAIVRHVGGVETKREFMWLPAHVPSAVDPLAQFGWGSAKVIVEQEVDRDAYLAVLAVEGWRPMNETPPLGVPIELRDVYIDGAVRRYVRPSEPRV